MLVQAWNIKVRQADYSKYQKLFKQNLSCQSSVWEKHPRSTDKISISFSTRRHGFWNTHSKKKKKKKRY